MKRTMVWTHVAVLMLVAASCGSESGSGSDQDGGGATVTLTEAESTSEVSVETGDRIEVRLESNPSTGFGWVVDDPTAGGLARLESSSFEEPSDPELVGAPGTEVFVFEIIQPGAAVLRLQYVRPFDDPIVPEKIVEYIVRVDGAAWPPAGVEPPDTSTASVPPDGADDS